MRALASLALALALTGCVSMDTFKKKEAEASKFRQDWEDEVANRPRGGEVGANTQEIERGAHFGCSTRLLWLPTTTHLSGVCFHVMV